MKRKSHLTLPVTVGVLALVGVGAAVLILNSASTSSMNANPAQIAEGKRVYIQHCASCHGANLEGQPNWKQELPTGGRPAPPHDATGHTWHHPDSYLFNVVKQGGQANSPPGYVNLMPVFGDKLKDDEIQAVMAYIKSTWPPDIQAYQRERQ
jgi:mono/diheme cytochrome c family protein